MRSWTRLVRMLSAPTVHMVLCQSLSIKTEYYKLGLSCQTSAHMQTSVAVILNSINRARCVRRLCLRKWVALRLQTVHIGVLFAVIFQL